MQRALDTHDTVLRALLARYYGYEVTTEGDSFTMAFHDPVDAVLYTKPSYAPFFASCSDCSMHLKRIVKYIWSAYCACTKILHTLWRAKHGVPDCVVA